MYYTMGTYHSSGIISESIKISENKYSQTFQHTFVACQCALEMTKNGKDTNSIIELINRNIIPEDSSDEEYNKIIDILNDIMLEFGSRSDTKTEDILLLDRIIRTIIYDKTYKDEVTSNEEDNISSNELE